MFNPRLSMAIAMAMSTVSYQHHSFHDRSLRIRDEGDVHKGKRKWEDRSCYDPHQGPREMARRKVRWSMASCRCIEGKLKGRTAIAINIKNDMLDKLGFSPGDVVVQLDDITHEMSHGWHKVNPSAWVLRSPEHDKNWQRL